MIDQIELFKGTYLTDIQASINKKLPEYIKHYEEEVKVAKKESDKLKIADLLDKYENDNEMLTFIKSHLNNNFMKNNNVGRYKFAWERDKSPKHLKKDNPVKTMDKPITQITPAKDKHLYIVGTEIEAKNVPYSILAPKFIFTDRKAAIAKLNEIMELRPLGRDKIFLFAVNEGEEIHPITM